MDEPRTGGELLSALLDKYKTDELEDVVRESKISRTTLDNWKARPAAKLRKTGRDHYRRVFMEQAPAPAPDLAAIDARLARIEQRLDSLLTLRGEPGRIEQMIRSKARAKAAGGSV